MYVLNSSSRTGGDTLVAIVVQGEGIGDGSVGVWCESYGGE